MKATVVWIAALPIAMLAYRATTAVSGPPLLPAVVAAAPAPPGEVARIAAHLERVERELLAAEVGHLTAQQRAARAGHIRVLREYREGGIFPHNHDFTGELVPYFVDEHGTLCAMAYLISRSGWHDLVERVAAARNNARVPELAADAELLAWLDEAGLSLREAARIQPQYGKRPAAADDPSEVTEGYAVASALTSGVGGVSIAMNLLSLDADRRSRLPGVIGIAAGVVGVGLGADRIGDGGSAAIFGAANAGIGLLSAGIGAWNLLRLPGDDTASDGATSAASSGPVVSAAPLLGPTSRGAVGLGFRVRF